MATSLGNDDNERDKRIELVGEYYFTIPNASVRSTAKFFTDNYFDISVATVSNYLARYKKRHPKDAIELEKVINSRKPDTINDEFVRERIANEVSLLRQGYTVEQISNTTGVEYWTVYHDLDTRLEKLDVDTYNEVKEILDVNRHSHPRKK